MNTEQPELPCAACGVIDTPTVLPGTGPHHAKAVCAHCGQFLKWLPKPKEDRMTASCNKVLLIGTLGDRGVDVTFTQNSTACATFVLVVQESGKTPGQVFSTYVGCEVWGKGAEAAGELEAGTLVLFDGRLRWRAEEPGSKTGKLVVSGFELKPLLAKDRTP